MKLSPTIANFIQKHVSHATSGLLYALIVFIPFSLRYVFHSPIAYQTGSYSDFTSYSIYLSDFIALGIVSLAILFHMKHEIPRIWKFSAIGFGLWLVLELVLQDKGLLSLQLYFSIRLIFLILFSVSVAKISVSREKLAWLFSILGAIQSLIAVIQFYSQKSIGLYLIGESQLNSEILGVAKIVSHGTKLIRGYGTFPHPNLLSGFLVAVTLLNLYLITNTKQKSRGILLYLLLFINIFGIFITFSRGGLVSLLVGLSITTVYIVITKNWRLFWKSVVPTGIIILISSIILLSYLTPRATVSDNATKERIFYTNIGKNIIKSQPFVGVGPGTSVLHMKQYSPAQLEPWEVQPIHNYWLLAWAELGIGAVLLLALTLSPIILLIKRGLTLWSIILLSILSSFFVIFLLDHYFYTIWMAQLLLWLIVGLIMREITYDKVSRQE